MGVVDFDAMEEYCIIDLPGGEVPPAVFSEKGMQTERLKIVEKEIQTEHTGNCSNMKKPFKSLS